MRLELLLKQPKALPTVPELALKLIATFEQDDPDLRLLALDISTDPVLMAKLLKQIGAPVPESKRANTPTIQGEGGFACQRPGCTAGPRAVQLQRAPMSDEMGQKVYTSICAQCWQDWLGMGKMAMKFFHRSHGLETMFVLFVC